MTESGSNQRNVSILLCTPIRGGTSPSYDVAVDKLAAWCRSKDIQFDKRRVAEAPVDAARDTLAAAYMAAVTPMDRPYTHCLMIDSGVGFHVEAIEKLINADEDFTAIAVPLRQTDIEAVAKSGEASRGPRFAVEFPRDTRETGRTRVTNKNGGAFTEINAIGAALICVRQRVFMRMFDAYPELRHRGGFSYFRPTIMTDDGESHVTRLCRAIDRALQFEGPSGKKFLTEALVFDHEQVDACGEDISFARRWTRLDSESKPAKIWLLCDATVMHEGHGYFLGNFSDSFSA